MATDNYIAAAKEANRVPTVFMKVESADGDTLYYTTQGDWQGSDTLTNIDTTEEPSSVINERFNQNAVVVVEGTVVTFNFQLFTVPYDQHLSKVIHPFLAVLEDDGKAHARVKITNTNPVTTTPTRVHVSAETVFTREANGNILGVFENAKVDQILLTGETWYVSVEFSNDGIWFQAPAAIDTPDSAFSVESIKPTSQLKTSAIEFADITNSNPIFSVDDITEAGALIAYSYEFSDLGSVFTSGGSIVDGDSLIASKFYKITADFTTESGGRGKIREFQLEEGLFRFFGSHIDEPFSGVLPLLVKNSVSSFSQKITIGKGLSTTGQASVKMFWVPETSDLIASGYLKGQDVSIFSGFKGLGTQDYEPVIVGTWFDHSLDEIEGEITVKIQDAFKQFEKRKIPEEVVDPVTSQIDTASIANDITFTATSLVTAMKQVFDEIGLRDRYISPDFDTLESGDYAASKYKVSRVLHKPTDSSKLLDELAQTGSMFLIPLGNGRIKPKPFDINQEHTAELDADEIDFVNLEGNLDRFFTRFNLYYNPKTTLTAEPRDDRDDFDNGVGILDSNAELRWFPEKGIKDHFDKWKVGRTSPSTPLTSPPQALIDKGALDNALLTEPLYTMTAKKMGPRFADIEPADVVQVNNLELPVVNETWNDSPTYNNKTTSLNTSGATGVAFSDDGFFMYVIDDVGTESIDQYSLSTAFDVSTASDDSKSINISAEISVAAYGLWLKPDGTKLYVSSSGVIYQYGMVTPFDASTGSYDGLSFNFAETSASSGVFIKEDGSKLYLANWVNGDLFQYTMTTPWLLSSITYDNVTNSTASQDTTPIDIFLSSDGEKLFMSGFNTKEIYQYSLGSAFDISVMIFDGIQFPVSGQAAQNFGMSFNGSGNIMYVIDTNNNDVYQYSLPVAFDLDSQTYTEGDRVIHDGKMWRARQDNAGKDPISEAAFWQDTEIDADGFTNGKHFFVLGRKFNPNNALIELDLMEMPPGTIGAFDSGFSSGFNI